MIQEVETLMAGDGRERTPADVANALSISEAEAKSCLTELARDGKLSHDRLRERGWSVYLYIWAD